MLAPLEIRLATPSDVARIFSAFYAAPRPFLYARTLAELDAIRRHGLLVCTSEVGGSERMLTSSYIHAGAVAASDAAQLGGGIADPALRRSGIMRLIGALSISRWLLDHPGAVIESRVVAANAEPIRPLLESLGFTRAAALWREDPSLHGSGMRHWPVDDEGLIPVECWRSTPTSVRWCAARIAAFTGEIYHDGVATPCRIHPALLERVDGIAN